jgi:hypothetical protein
LPKYPSREVEANGQTYDSSKPLSNNLRFHNCTFEGAVVSANPKHF